MHHLTLRSAAILALLVWFASCETKKDDPAPTPAPTGAIRVHTTKLLSGQNNTPQASFFSTVSGTVYQSLAIAKDSCLSVDFIYVFRNSADGGRVLTSPNGQDSYDVYGADPTNPNRIQVWNPALQTGFTTKLNVSAADFDAISTEAGITNLVTTSNTTETAVRQLAIGDVFGFKTGWTKRGIARVTAVSGDAAFVSGATNNSNVTLTVKVIK